MNRYYFHFREGDEIALDRIGMYLPSLDAARDEAVRTWQDLLEVAADGGELSDCAIQIADAGGESVLTIPFGYGAHLH